MAPQPRYPPGPDIPDEETLRDSQGRLIDDAYVQAAAEEALVIVRGRGRPSLSETGESPLLRVRLPRDLDQAITRAAERAGQTRADWIRHLSPRPPAKPADTPHHRRNHQI